jgi:branched-chain amino acid transport system permease protein
LPQRLTQKQTFGGLFLGESLGQVGIFVIFIAVLLLRPQGFFGAKA